MHVIRALPSEVLAAVHDLTRDITAATPQPYLQLKEALLSRFTVSPLQQCFQLLDMPPLGDRRPSALFSEMQALLPKDANILFNAIYLRRLPDYMRIALTDRGELLPGDLPAAADLLQHSAPTPAATIAAVSAPPQPPIAAVHAVPAPFHCRQSRSPTPRRRPLSPPRWFPTPHRSRAPLLRPPANSGLCFYHYNFGRQARRCQPPCNWQGNE
jgi:hypothetical protein